MSTRHSLSLCVDERHEGGRDREGKHSEPMYEGMFPESHRALVSPPTTHSNIPSPPHFTPSLSGALDVNGLQRPQLYYALMDLSTALRALRSYGGQYHYFLAGRSSWPALKVLSGNKGPILSQPIVLHPFEERDIDEIIRLGHPKILAKLSVGTGDEK